MGIGRKLAHMSRGGEEEIQLYNNTSFNSFLPLTHEVCLVNKVLLTSSMKLRASETLLARLDKHNNVHINIFVFYLYARNHTRPARISVSKLD